MTQIEDLVKIQIETNARLDRVINLLEGYNGYPGLCSRFQKLSEDFYNCKRHEELTKTVQSNYEKTLSLIEKNAETFNNFRMATIRTLTGLIIIAMISGGSWALVKFVI